MKLSFQSATDFLANIDSDWAQLIATVGPCLLESKPERNPYQALVRAVAYQQLHARAGDAILLRLLTLHSGEFPPPETLLTFSFDELRACGFSGRKIETIQGIAQAVIDGIVPDMEVAQQMSDEALINQLVTLKGIGRWTVEMMLIFTLNRRDIMPVDDFGVKDGYRRLKNLATAPTSKGMGELGKAWSPYRTIAAWYLWRVPR